MRRFLPLAALYASTGRPGLLGALLVKPALGFAYEGVGSGPRKQLVADLLFDGTNLTFRRERNDRLN
jgi:hypothetical protein